MRMALYLLTTTGIMVARHNPWFSNRLSCKIWAKNPMLRRKKTIATSLRPRTNSISSINLCLMSNPPQISKSSKKMRVMASNHPRWRARPSTKKFSNKTICSQVAGVSLFRSLQAQIKVRRCFPRDLMWFNFKRCNRINSTNMGPVRMSSPLCPIIMTNPSSLTSAKNSASIKK